jgi:hypothetical protein
MMTWKPLSLVAAIVLAHILIFATFGDLGFAPIPTPRPTPHATYTPNPDLARHYISPTVTPTPRPTPGPTSVFSGGPEKF